MLLELERVKKNYDSFSLDCSMEVKEGCVTGLIGANGAGKSTTFKAILNLIRPDSGTIRIFGKDAASFEGKDKEKIGVVLSDSTFSGYLKEDFLAHCLLKLEEQTPQGKKYWAETEKAEPALAAVSASLRRESEPNELLMVYPYPDYLSRMAEKQGISPKEWKRISFFPRKKGGKAREIHPEIKE